MRIRRERCLKIVMILLVPLLIICLVYLQASVHQTDKKDVLMSDEGEHSGLSQSAEDAKSPQLPSVCSDETCKVAYLRNIQSRDAYPIPGIRHFLWRTEKVSKYFVPHLLSWHRIHSNWTYVLWRDQDMELFVATHFPGLLAKFRSLQKDIMKVDMIRYMILYKYGGVYADLDYSLALSLDSYRRFHAVITREPECHALQELGMTWPVKIVANAAFMMSAPGHIFLHEFMVHLSNAKSDNILQFAGPRGLTESLNAFQKMFPTANHAMETIYIPPSYSFYPYPDNKINTDKVKGHAKRITVLNTLCRSLKPRDDPQQRLKRYCTDVNNMDPITDRTQPVVAIHDREKLGTSWDGSPGLKYFTEDLIDARLVIKGLKLGADFMRM